ncbi:hypothetical protein SEA_ZIKO_22 [Gordonia phage Ziko]|uniref:Uncharacterized protein n=1 Tax=Gordonia phage Ziko TaxID=2591193 RepID=A0A514A540_9CAUD|nr:hypothetical protein SEA_ZIKO_22 [Gordonia phage Ziko]
MTESEILAALCDPPDGTYWITSINVARETLDAALTSESGSLPCGYLSVPQSAENPTQSLYEASERCVATYNAWMNGSIGP